MAQKDDKKNAADLAGGKVFRVSSNPKPSPVANKMSESEGMGGDVDDDEEEAEGAGPEFGLDYTPPHAHPPHHN